MSDSTLIQIPETLIVPDGAAPSEQLTRALQEAISYSAGAHRPAASGSPIQTGTPSMPAHAPTASSSSPTPSSHSNPSKRPLPLMPSASPATLRAHSPMRRVPSPHRGKTSNVRKAGVLFWGLESWATGEEASLLVEEAKVGSVVYAFRDALDFLYTTQKIPRNAPFVLLHPSMSSLDEPFMETIQDEAEVIYDIREHFNFVPYFPGEEEGVWECKEGNGFGLPQRLIDSIFFQSACCIGGSFEVPIFLSKMASLIGCDPLLLVPLIFWKSKRREDVRDAASAAKFYSKPLPDPSISWISIPDSLASDDARKTAIVGKGIIDALRDCEKRHEGYLNVLLPSDSREEVAFHLAQLGEDTGANKLLEEKLDKALDSDDDAGDGHGIWEGLERKSWEWFCKLVAKVSDALSARKEQ